MFSLYNISIDCTDSIIQVFEWFMHAVFIYTHSVVNYCIIMYEFGLYFNKRELKWPYQIESISHFISYMHIHMCVHVKVLCSNWTRINLRILHLWWHHHILQLLVTILNGRLMKCWHSGKQRSRHARLEKKKVIKKAVQIQVEFFS